MMILKTKYLALKKNIYFSVEDALKWLSRLFNDKIRSWENLKKFVPLDIKHLRLKKSAIISLLLASMSMARKGELKINQEKPFSNIFIKLIDKNSKLSKFLKSVCVLKFPTTDGNFIEKVTINTGMILPR